MDGDVTFRLKKRIGVQSVTSLIDISKVNEFVFTVVPVPLLAEMRLSHQNLTLAKLLEYLDLWEHTLPTKNGEYGNWCGFHAHLMVLLLRDVYGFKNSKVWGYGFPRVINHVAVMVTWAKTRYTFDPYFGLHYITPQGAVLSFDELQRLLRAKDFSNIRIHHAALTLKKKVMTVAGSSPNTHKWIQMSSPEFYERILCLFKEHQSERQLMAKFGHTEHMCLMLLT